MPLMENSPQTNQSAEPEDATMKRQIPCFSSPSLFGQSKTVHIEHEGKIYELRLTRQGKLILTA